MKISLSNDSASDVGVDLLAIGLRSADLSKSPVGKAIDEAMGGVLARVLKEEDFGGRSGETVRIPVTGGIGAKWLLVVGLGNGKEARAIESRTLGMRAVASAKQQKTIAVVPVEDDAEHVQAVVEGLATGGYRYTQYLTGSRKPKGGVQSALVLVADAKKAETKSALVRGQVIGEATNVVRDLVNAPPNDMNPPALAEAARRECDKLGVECKVWNKKQIEKAGMHLFLAVNRGSAIEPRFVHMTYKPARARNAPKVVFVGKGLTFDSGGLCIKPGKSMVDMKCDMAGAAVTIGIVIAAARLKLPVEVHGLIGSTENMINGNAYRPGDVFPSLDGKTVEIINTDAEGRLVLADVLTYARELEPDYLIDHATLTGACMVALGPWTAGLFANDDELARLYGAASEKTGESYWRLPLHEDLREMLKSDIADLKHTGEAYGGAITAALFLREFVGNCKWAHCDIAGPAFQASPHGMHPKGGTGFGVATAIRFLSELGR